MILIIERIIYFLAVYHNVTTCNLIFEADALFEMGYSFATPFINQIIFF